MLCITLIEHFVKRLAAWFEFMCNENDQFKVRNSKLLVEIRSTKSDNAKTKKFKFLDLSIYKGEG